MAEAVEAGAAAGASRVALVGERAVATRVREPSVALVVVDHQVAAVA